METLPVYVRVMFISLTVPAMAIILYGRKYYKHLNHFAIKQRYGCVVVVEASLQCIQLITFSIVFLSHLHSTIIYVYYQLNTTLFIALFSCWILRFVSLCFDIKWITSKMDHDWIYVINSSASQLNEPKILRKLTNTLGNIKWNLYHIIIPCNIFCFAIFAFLNIFRAVNIILRNENIIDLDWIAWSFWLFVILVSWAILLFTYLSIPKFQDCIYVMKELKYVIISLTTQLLMNIVASVLYTLYNNGIIWYYIVLFISRLSGAIATIISTRYVLIKVLPMTPPNSKKKRNNFESIPMLEMQLSLMGNMEQSIESYQLKEILNDKQMFQVYMLHLSKEFSMKLLLALIECIQLQQYIFMKKDMMNVNINPNDKFAFQKIQLYDDIVKSEIVFNNEEEVKSDQLTQIKKKANKLFNKYIEYGSVYEIFITENTRGNMSEVMSHLDWIEDDDINVNHVMKLFDDCGQEIYFILLSQFGRFQATNQY
eukprot:224548_1